MAVENPMHLSEGRHMTIRRGDGSTVTATLLHNDCAERVLCLEVQEGEFEQVGYAQFQRANYTSLKGGMTR